jgi:ubiquinone biosynthesis protein COQ9
MQDFRPTLLHHVLELVPFEGWSDFTLREAARLSGINNAEAIAAFPNVSACIRYYFEQVDESVRKQFPESVLATKRVPERIETLLMARFAAMLPHRDAVKRAASARLLPWNSAEALRSLFSMTDWMWRASGDRSTDFNYYTKRMTLAGVYVSTFLFWLSDTSTDMALTRQFLKRRLSGVADFGKKKKALLTRLNAFSYYAKR